MEIQRYLIHYMQILQKWIRKYWTKNRYLSYIYKGLSVIDSINVCPTRLISFIEDKSKSFPQRFNDLSNVLGKI